MKLSPSNGRSQDQINYRRGSIPIGLFMPNLRHVQKGTEYSAGALIWSIRYSLPNVSPLKAILISLD